MPSEQQVLAGGRRWNFDRAYWSHRQEDSHFATQQTLMDEIGAEVLDNAMEGFNSCLFAYGQTGAGKTHSVLGGEGEQRGLLPRILQALFDEIAEESGLGRTQYHCTVSYLEIYNEQLRDLLVPVDERTRAQLVIRNHPKLGVYVPGLTESVVTKWTEVIKMIDFGQSLRSVAATSMNATSSRSHCIFTFFLEKEMAVAEGRQESSRARVNLVDLAGSERQKKTHAEGQQLKEGAMINQSLSNLATVIHALALNSGGERNEFVSFRNSKLTHLLQESLSGNSKTVMMAAISPAESNLEETLSTLRFAQTCKRVTTKAVKNAESISNVIEELKAEIARLKESQAAGGAAADPELLSRLLESEALRAKLEEDRESQLQEARRRDEERAKVLEDMGLSMDELSSTLRLDPHLPKLINMSDDPSLCGCLVYYLMKNAETVIGSDRASCRIVLMGLGILPHMCSLSNEENQEVHLKLLTSAGHEVDAAGLLLLGKQQGRQGADACGRVLVNGRVPQDVRQELRHTDRLIFGQAFCFRLVVPLLAEAMSPTTSTHAAAGGTLQDALLEVVDVCSDEFPECRALIDSIQDRIGERKARGFLEIFGRALPMVQEANHITSIVRPEGKLRFKLEVCTDIMRFSTAEPELVVRLYDGSGSSGNDVVIDVAEVRSFGERLQHLREVYAEFQARPERIGFSRPGVDPWAVLRYSEVQDMLSQSERSRDAQAQQVAQLRAQLAEERRLRELAEAAAAREAARAAELMRRLAAVEGSPIASGVGGGPAGAASGVPAALPLGPRDSGGSDGDLEIELRRSREETAATARLAAQLLAGIQSMVAAGKTASGEPPLSA